MALRKNRQIKTAQADFRNGGFFYAIDKFIRKPLKNGENVSNICAHDCARCRICDILDGDVP